VDIFAWNNFFLDMPRWQRGFIDLNATGCRPVYGSSKIREPHPPLSTLPHRIVKVNLPRGSKILFMLSGGLDSPVAMKIAKKIFKPTPVHFMLSEFYSLDYVENFVEILKVIKNKVGFKKMFVVPFSNVLKRIVKRGPRKYRCVLCRKSMLKACEFICDSGFKAIATGEVIGQKASQTLFNLISTAHGIKYPILYPLLGFDKSEIYEMAKKYGLVFDKHIGHCLMVPKYPVTRSKVSIVEKIFKKIEVVKLIKECVEKRVVIKKPEEMLMVVE